MSTINSITPGHNVLTQPTLPDGMSISMYLASEPKPVDPEIKVEQAALSNLGKLNLNGNAKTMELKIGNESFHCSFKKIDGQNSIKIQKGHMSIEASAKGGKDSPFVYAYGFKTRMDMLKVLNAAVTQAQRKL